MSVNLYKIKLRIKYFPPIKWVFRVLNKLKFIVDDKQKQSALKEHGNSLAVKCESLLTEYNVNYFLYFGSLLGLVRDGKFMEHDDDVDYGIIVSDKFSWEDFESFLTNHKLKKIRQFSLNGKITEQTYEYNGLTVDFFGCFIHNGVMNSYLYYRKDNYIYNSRFECHVGRFDYIKVIEVKKVQFHGKSYTIPANAEDLLTSIYSKNWRIPDKKWDHTKWKNFHELKIIAKSEYFR